MARKKVTIDQSMCIGCSSCAGAYADDFMMDDNGLATPITGECEEEAADICPVGAITIED